MLYSNLYYGLDDMFPTADIFSAFFINIFKRAVKISFQYEI